MAKLTKLEIYNEVITEFPLLSPEEVQALVRSKLKNLKKKRPKLTKVNIGNQKIGNILLELEVVLDKMVNQGLQLGDILALVKAHCEIHRQDCIEEYIDGTRPVFYYGHKDYKCQD